MGRIFKRQIALLALFLFSALSLKAEEIVVQAGSGNPIAEAFEKAQDGDVIIIKSGVYTPGALVLDKEVSIKGEGMPVLDGEGKHEILLLEANNVTIDGLVFRNSGFSNYQDVAALKIKDSEHVLIQNCRLENNFFGIHTNNSKYITYKNNHLIVEQGKVKTLANGIHCCKTDHFTLENNIVEGHRDGFYFEFVTNSTIENNKSIGNPRYGLHFMFSHDNVYRNNVFRKNGAGVAVMYSKRVEMYNNLFADSWGGAAYGLLLKEINDSKIFDNFFTDNTMAIFADGANRIEMKHNQFSNNGWAIKANASCSSLELDENNFIANTFDFATNGNLVMKSMKNNYWDKYEGYDLDRNGVGDVPYHPVTFYSIIIEKNPGALMLFRSVFVKLLDKAESVFPSLTPEHLKDEAPVLKKHKIKIDDYLL